MILIFLCMFIGLLIGKLLSKKIARKYLFYKDIVDFLAYTKLNVSSYQTKLQDIVKSYTNNKKSNIFDFDDFDKYLKDTSINAKFYLNDVNFISLQEKQEIEESLMSMGKYNVENEIENLRKVDMNLRDKMEESYEVLKKYSSIYIKLGILFGVLLGILLI